MEKLRLQFLQALFGALMLGNVVDETGEESPLSNPSFSDQELHRKRGAVVTAAHYDAPGADDSLFSRRLIASDVAVMLIMIGRWHENFDILSDDLRRFITEKARSGRAEGFNDPLFVDRNDGVRNRLQDRTKSRFAFAQP